MPFGFHIFFLMALGRNRRQHLAIHSSFFPLETVLKEWHPLVEVIDSGTSERRKGCGGIAGYCFGKQVEKEREKCSANGRSRNFARIGLAWMEAKGLERLSGERMNKQKLFWNINKGGFLVSYDTLS